jgi:dihydrofolate synthase/folylpolyglutamate synthase
MLTLTSLQDAPALLEAHWPAKKSRHRMSLDHMHELMTYLGDPQNKVKVIHIAGTSGKTSTAYYCATLLQAAGKRVGMTVSPHVDSLNERVQIDMIPLPEAVFCAELNEFMRIVGEGGFALTYFEVLYAFAYWEFVRQHVEYAVVEVGIGGLLDTTNVISRADKICILTDIGYDHMGVLGTTLPAIAAQKAGIITLHNYVCCWRQPDEVLDVFKHAAKQQQADIEILQAPQLDTQVSFLPAFQQRNFELATHAVAYALHRDGAAPLPKDAMQLAAHVRVPARMEVVPYKGKTVIIDGSHNRQKLRALTTAVRARYPDMPVTVVAAFAHTNNPVRRTDGGLRELTAIAQHLLITRFVVDRSTPHASLDSSVIAQLCQQTGYRSYDVIDDPVAAFEAAIARPEPVVVVAGSFYLLNHIRPLLFQHSDSQ